MNRGLQDDFKRDGMFSQIIKRISDLEAFEREFRLKQFASGVGYLWLPFGVYQNPPPMSASPSTPYAVTVGVDMTLVTWAQDFLVLAPHDANNYWTIRVHTLNAGAGFPIINSFNTSGAAATWYQNIDSTWVSTALTAANDLGLYIQCVKAGATALPGNLFLTGPMISVTVP